MPLAAIIFDFDGVIANSEPLHYRAFADQLQTRNVVLSQADYYGKYLGFDDAGAFLAIARDRKLPWSADDVARMVASKAVRMEQLEREVSVLFPGAADAVRRAAAVVPLAIASGALTAEICRVLEREQLISCFGAVVGADQTAVSKPAPDPYVRAVAQLSAKLRTSLRPRDCVAIEDSHWGIESARAAGLRTVGVAQTYPADSLALADFVIDTIDRLDVDRLRTLFSS